MNPIPQAVIFDLGKVLLDFDFSIAARALLPHSRVSESEMRLLLDQSPLLHRYESGQMTSAQFYEAVRVPSGFSGNYENFAAAFAAIFTPIPPMIEMAMSLRERKIPIYIFSNTNEIAANHIREQYPFFAHFDGYVFSYEHGAMKPAESVYRVVEQMTGQGGSALLYLDDRLENIQTAQKRGWQTIHHISVDQTLAEMRRGPGGQHDWPA